MANYYFPEEIMLEILVRLPVKSLLRFMCVCQSWFFTIQDPTFVTKHLTLAEKTSNKNNYLLLHFHKNLNPLESYSLRLDRPKLLGFETQQQGEEHYLPRFSGLPNRDLKVYGVCNGLLCVAENFLVFADSIYIWNPIARKVKTLPRSTIPWDYKRTFSCIDLAFGVDPNNINEYKVLRIAHLVLENPRRYLYRVGIYSTSTNRWKTITQSCSTELPALRKFVWKQPNSSTRFMNGGAYWIGRRWSMTRRNIKKRIVRFDMGDEKFREIKFPNCAHRGDFSIDSYGGSMALFGMFDGYFLRSLQIWVSQEGECHKHSWEKKLAIDFEPGVYGHPLGFRNNGEVLIPDDDGFGYGDGSALFSCKLEEIKVELKEDFGLLFLKDEKNSFCRVDSFVESLVLVDQKFPVIKSTRETTRYN